ncbi:hypothetical protein IJS77_00860 [bacterium]|nr:hypothetical protein [bacterium]
MMIKMYEMITYAIVVIMLGVIYFACFNVAHTGYGYSGYKGYHRAHSYWYIRHYDQNYGPSVREKSLGGHNASGKGMSGGK